MQDVSKDTNVHKKSVGFSLIEIVVAIAIIALLATIAIPTMRGLLPKNEPKILLQNINSITLTALDNAVFSGKLNRVVFDFTLNKIYVEQATEQKDVKGDFIFEKLPTRFATSEIDWDQNKFTIQNFYIDTRDEMRLGMGQTKKEKMWFYVLPEGTAQLVTINLIDLTQSDITEGAEFSFVLNPFTVQFKLYEKFSTP